MNKKRKTELPTDEQLIELLWKIKNTCKNNNACEHCPLKIEGICNCHAERLLIELNGPYPCYWNMEEIERIIKL